MELAAEKMPQGYSVFITVQHNRCTVTLRDAKGDFHTIRPKTNDQTLAETIDDCVELAIGFDVASTQHPPSRN